VARSLFILATDAEPAASANCLCYVRMPDEITLSRDINLTWHFQFVPRLQKATIHLNLNDFYRK